MGRSDVDAVLQSGTARATTGLLFAPIAVSSSGDNTLLAADATHKIKVVGYTIVAASAVSAKFKSGATDLSGAMSLAANGGVVSNSLTFAHLLETAINSALILNLSGAVAVSGHFSYFLEA